MSGDRYKNIIFSSEEYKDQLAFWMNRLSGNLQFLNLPYNSQNLEKKKGNKDIETINLVLSDDTWARLQHLGNHSDIAIYTILLAAFNVFLSKYTGETDILIGSPLLKTGAQGRYNKTVALRSTVKSGETFKDTLIRTKQMLLEVYKNQGYPIDLVFEKLGIDKGDINKYLNIQFLLTTIHNAINLKELESDMLILWNKEVSALRAELVFDKNTFEYSAMKCFLDSYIMVLESVLNDINITISNIKIFRPEVESRLLSYSAGTVLPYPRLTLHELFEMQAERTPDAIAAVCEDKSVSYKELNEMSNRLARVLRKKGLKADAVTAIMAERSVEFISAILGVLKAGGAYLPIDPEYPADRIGYMLKDSGASILITQRHLQSKYIFEGETICMEDSFIQEEVCGNLEKTSEQYNLAYVIYTSGSTGAPKGVMIENRSVVNLVFALDQAIYKKYGRSLNIAMVSPFVFDASIKQIFPSLLLGHTLFIISGDTRLEGKKLLEYYAENAIDIADGTPIHLNILINAMEEAAQRADIKEFVIGGETLSKTAVRDVFKKFSSEGLHITNVYGPTECCDVTTTHTINAADSDSLELISIGRPIANSKVYILNKNMELAPIGVSGEMYIGGDGVARGYLNKRDLTEKRFIKNPLNHDEIIYSTGDLVKWLEDGQIQYIGRADQQVKIRGYRIELGEIENLLVQHQCVKDAVVVDREDENGNKYLCAYLVAAGIFAEPPKTTSEQLSAYLKTKLPQYMIPSYFVYLDKIPMTVNGKVDKKALPEPLRGDGDGIYEAPRNPAEEKMAAIWKLILGVKNIGINNDFFELGGDSLKATNLVARIYKEYNAEIPLREIFRSPTIKRLMEYMDKAGSGMYEPIKAVEEQAHYSVSSAQKRLYALQQLEPDSAAYNMPGVFLIEGELSRDSLEKAFRQLIQRHDALRTSFSVLDGECVQRVSKHMDFNIEYIEICEEKAEAVIKSFIKPFDLHQVPLFRAALLKLAQNKHILMYDMHHIISDGISMRIFIRDLCALYEGKELYELKIQYKDFVSWQNSTRIKAAAEKQKAYWLSCFTDKGGSGNIPVLSLPTDFPRPSVHSYQGDSLSFTIDGVLKQKLNAIAKDSGSTLFMVLLAIYNILLSKYSGQEDIVIGTPVAGRRHSDLEEVMGVFVNTLAMRNYPSTDKTFMTFLTEVRDNALKAFDNQDYQFEELVELLNVKRDISRNPVFDVMFVLQNIKNTDVEQIGIKIEPYTFESKISKFDITLSASETPKEIIFNLEYCTSLFTKDTAKRMAQYFVNIAQAVADNRSIGLSRISLLGDEQKSQLFKSYNDMEQKPLPERTIVDILEEQAELRPDADAVLCGPGKLTYGELNQKVNQLAKLLLSKGLKKEDIVSIMLEPSIEMIIGILGVLKAGAAYLPIDDEYPEDRVRYMLTDSGTKLLLTQRKLSGKAVEGIEEIYLDAEETYFGEAANTGVKVTPSDLAYVIYTSGSTGRPKGVMIEHKSLLNLCLWFNREFEMKSTDRCSKYAGSGFDVSVSEIFTSLTAGAALCIIDKGIRLDMHSLNKYLESNGVTVSFLPTQIGEQFMELDNSSLRLLYVGGEKLKSFRRTSYEVINMYGPTESTVITTAFRVDKDYANIPIGKPVDNTKVYILDKHGNPVPMGVPGELCIGGVGLARGYLDGKHSGGRALTAEKFVENPFVPGERMYRSGDLVRWVPWEADEGVHVDGIPGNIEFLGRIDQQVKIRGYRVELEEIEKVILSSSDENSGEKLIKEAAVLALDHESSEKYLCAFIVPNKGQNLSYLKAYLQSKLPQYMVPPYFMELDSLPLTANGKLDKNVLTVLGKQHRYESAESAAPYEDCIGKYEEKTASIWSQVLEIPRISRNAHFFELGGNSIKAIKMISEFKKELGIDIPLNVIFKKPILKELSSYVEGSQRKAPITENQSTILLREGTSKDQNIFFIHGGGGDVGGYMPLCEKLEPSCHCWGIRLERNNLGPENLRIEEIAENHIRKIKEIQHSGPYTLCGWSIGGTIAYEIAKQLEEAGEELQGLMIIDSYMPEKSTYDKELSSHSTMTYSTDTELKYIREIFNNESLCGIVNNAKSPDEIWEALIGYMQERGLKGHEIPEPNLLRQISRIIPHYRDMDIRELVKSINTIRTLELARERYAPVSKLKTDSVFIKAAESEGAKPEAWRPFFQESFNVIEIQGDHFSIMEGACAEAAANILYSITL